MLTETKNFTIKDLEYRRDGDRSLKLRLFRPVGETLAAAIIDIHGGAWNNGDRTGCQARDEVLAEAGFAVAALDFRQAEDGYPTSLIDINYAIRWLKGHAKEFGIDPARVGISGQSSGGHLAMLAAMRPLDPRYTEIVLDVVAPSIDATVKCVGMMWPVINPLSRYRHALRSRASTSPGDWVGNLPESHDRYWVTEENMAEGNPMLALERKEPVKTPPAIWVQGRPDVVHDYRDPESDAGVNEPERFAQNYRKAGGKIEVLYIDIAERSSHASFKLLADFYRKHLAS